MIRRLVVALVVHLAIGALMLGVQGAHAQTTSTTSTTSIPAGCAVFPCRTTDGNPPSTPTTSAPDPVAHFTG